MATIIDFVVSRRHEAAVRAERCVRPLQDSAAARLSANWHLDAEGRLVCSWQAARA